MWKKTAVAALLALPLTALSQNTPSGQPAGQPSAQPGTKSETKAPVKPLLVGDKALPLVIEKWLKGTPVTGFEKGRVYVLEFWSPTSFSSGSNMPHLTELQTQYKDKVTVIGIASKDARNGLEAVEKLVKEKNDTIGYTIGWESDPKSYTSYVEAAGYKYLPVTFIVDGSGILAHAQTGDDKQLDKPLSEIIGGTYDLKAAAEKSRKDAEEREKRARTEAIQAQSRKLDAAYKAKDWATVLSIYDGLPDEIKRNPRLAALRFEAMLLGTKDYEKTYAFGREIVDGAGAKDDQVLNEVAWAIVNPENKVEKKDLDLALKAATKADELKGGKNAAILDTVARVYFCRGDTAKALELQKKAIALIAPTDPPQTRTALEDSLKEYEAAAKK